MKRGALRFVAALSFLVALGIGVVQAQSAEIKTKVPFGFTINKTTLPAGEYVATRVTENRSLILIQSADRKSSVFVVTHSFGAEKEVSPRLVFNRYGSRYILSQIWMDGDGTGRGLPKSKLEAELAMQKTDTGRTVIAAQLR